jgi:hypothetical protein
MFAPKFLTPGPSIEQQMAAIEQEMVTILENNADRPPVTVPVGNGSLLTQVSHPVKSAKDLPAQTKKCLQQMQYISATGDPTDVATTSRSDYLTKFLPTAIVFLLVFSVTLTEAAFLAATSYTFYMIISMALIWLGTVVLVRLPRGVEQGEILALTTFFGLCYAVGVAVADICEYPKVISLIHAHSII